MKLKFLLYLYAVSILAYSNVSFAKPHDPRLHIQDVDKKCTKDSDCTAFIMECGSFCGCPQPFNKKFIDKYQKVHDDYCGDTDDDLECDYDCDELGQELICKNSLCTFAEKVTKDKKLPVKK